MRKSIVLLKSSDVNYTEIARQTGVPFSTVKRTLNGYTELDKVAFGTVEALHKYVLANQDKYNTRKIAEGFAETIQLCLDNYASNKSEVYVLNDVIKLNPRSQLFGSTEDEKNEEYHVIFDINDWNELAYEFNEGQLEEARISAIQKAIDEYLETV